MTYDLKPMKAPRAAGTLLRALTAIVENPLTSSALTNKLLGDAGILMMREAKTTDALPICPPQLSDRGESAAHAEVPPVDLDAVSRHEIRSSGFRFETVADFAEAFRGGRISPEQVARKVVEATALDNQRTPPMRAIIAQNADDVMAMARASTERHRNGKPLGPLDGVPIAVKDELDQAHYPTTVGTAFLGKTPAAQDATVVARLRAAGGVLIGKANMHEIGLGVTGLNPIHGAARNPYNVDRATGGSSSGSAAAVAAGLAPVALGADGGGSIRIPAGLCGVVGLKPTFGRVSEHGAAELCWSLAHVGPIASSVRDCALAYAVIAGPDERDPNSRTQPPVHLEDLANKDLRGVRLGVYRPWFEDAEPDVVRACKEAIDVLVDAGAKVMEVTIPELALLRAVHLVTIISEMAAAHIQHYANHREAYGLDTRLNLALARKLTAYDYAHAQRLRVRLCGHFRSVLESTDVLVTPTTGCTAPLLAKDALYTGESNLPMTDRILRFALAANVTGYPAISVPAGYGETGMPVGVQLMGRAWQESFLLRLASVVENGTPRRAPAVHHRFLPG